MSGYTSDHRFHNSSDYFGDKSRFCSLDGLYGAVMTTLHIIPSYTENLVFHQDMVQHAFERFSKTGYVLPPKQRCIYENLAVATRRKSILEAGCGIGLGTAILKRLDKPFLYRGEVVHRIVIGTDLSEKHLAFARQMFPACGFDLWDIMAGPYPAKLYDVVVAVEVIEHVGNAKKALNNMFLSTREEIWFSTPNRNAPEINKVQPRNPHHVHEYTPQEIRDMCPAGCDLTLHHWENLRELPLDTEITPVVYHIVI